MEKLSADGAHDKQEVDRSHYTFPPHPSGSRWDLTPDGYEGEDGLAYFADGTVDATAMGRPEYREYDNFGMDRRVLDDRYPEWARMAAGQAIMPAEDTPASPPDELPTHPHGREP
jgi:hypothetical protein